VKFIESSELLFNLPYDIIAEIRSRAHILEIHNPIKRCQRCKKLFGTELELDGHVQHERCEWQDRRHLFNTTALGELLKRSSPNLPHENIWQNMFRAVLPDVHEGNIPTPCESIEDSSESHADALFRLGTAATTSILQRVLPVPQFAKYF
jgi:hypothetical protein